MVVFAVAVVSKAGKALLSRQFIHITRSRIEGLLAAFPKLLGSGGQQHTYIETDSVRYLYQPMDTMYMVVLTNKASNILEDLETLHILTKLVPEYCRGVSEQEVLSKAFDLIFAFDEVIAMGYKEKVTVQQIKQFTEMDSNEEKIAEMLQETKIKEARLKAKQVRKELDRQRREREKMGISDIGPNRSQGYGGGRNPEPYIIDNNSRGGYQRDERGPSVGGRGYGRPEQQQEQQQQTSGGFDLSGKRRGVVNQTDKYLRKMQEEGDIDDIGDRPAAKKKQVAAAPVSNDPINIAITEHLNVSVDRDGGINRMEAKGDFTISITQQGCTQPFVRVTNNTDKSVQMKPHPNINRQRWAKESVICVKDVSRVHLPLHTPTGVLRWRMQSKDEDKLPLKVNCWPSSSPEGITIVNMEYELGEQRAYELHDVIIRVPVVGKDAPMVNQIESGTYDFDARSSTLEWRIPLINDDNRNGTLEFEIAKWQKDNTDTSFLFPIDVAFVSNKTVAHLEVEEVFNSEGGDPLKYSITSQLIVDSYTIDDD